MEHDQEEFVSRRLKKRLKNNDVKVVVDDDRFTSTVLDTKVKVAGKEVRDFAQAYESKLSEYLEKPFLRLLVDGVLTRSTPNFKSYVLGAAICKHYGLPTKRFIEVQFHYHDEWKREAPTLRYVTSLVSTWNSVGRYRQYCEKFKREIDYFAPGDDNINKAYRSSEQPGHASRPSDSLVRIYEEMILFQMEAKKISRKEALQLLGTPGKNRVPVKYLRTLPLYLELVAEDAWGKEAYEFDYYKRLKVEIENLINVR